MCLPNIVTLLRGDAAKRPVIGPLIKVPDAEQKEVHDCIEEAWSHDHPFRMVGGHSATGTGYRPSEELRPRFFHVRQMVTATAWFETPQLSVQH